MAWDHKVDYPMPSSMNGAGGADGAFQKTFELAGEHAFLADHQIDGRILMPVRPHSLTCLRQHTPFQDV